MPYVLQPYLQKFKSMCIEVLRDFTGTGTRSALCLQPQPKPG